MTSYKGWAVLEVMGHRQRIGQVEEVEMFGGKMLRIDIPAEGGDLTEFYGASSIYALRAVSEDYARDQVSRFGDPRPVRPLDYRQLPKPQASPAAEKPEEDDAEAEDADKEFPF